jgi:hypothetical protein
MRLTEEQHTHLMEVAKGDKAVKALLDWYGYVVNNSAYESYVARKVTLDHWNADLINFKPSLFSKDDDDEEKAKARDKEVDRVLKYLEKQTDLYEQTEGLLTKLTGDEQESLNKDTRLRTSSDRAFRPKTNGT